MASTKLIMSVHSFVTFSSILLLADALLRVALFLCAPKESQTFARGQKAPRSVTCS